MILDVKNKKGSNPSLSLSVDDLVFQKRSDSVFSVVASAADVPQKPNLWYAAKRSKD